MTQKRTEKQQKFEISFIDTSKVIQDWSKDIILVHLCRCESQEKQRCQGNALSLLCVIKVVLRHLLVRVWPGEPELHAAA